MKTNEMFNIERQQEIISLLNEYGSISVSKLSKLLYTSAPTIRRDLSALENQGKILRTHGGAVLRNAAENEIPLMLREDSNNKSKKNNCTKGSMFYKKRRCNIHGCLVDSSISHSEFKKFQ